MSSEIEKMVEEILPDEENYIYGFADMTGLIDSKYKGLNYAVVIGNKLNDAIIDDIESGPTPEYYKLYIETNTELSRLVGKIAGELKKINISAAAIEPTKSESDIDNYNNETFSSDFSHKMAATRAGLGWIGKTALFISERFGPRLRLASVLINRPVDNLYPPVEESKCGSCQICVDKCPAGAANGKLWDINIHRDEFFDPLKCREKEHELTKKILREKVSICGICVSVCPIGKK